MALSNDATRMLQVRYPTYAAKWNELRAIPGLEAEFARGFSLVNEASYLSDEDGGKASLGSTGVAIMDKALNDASTNPVGFVKSNLLESMVIGNVDLATNQVKYLQQNNVPISDISNLWQENISKIEQGQKRSREGNLGPMITTLALGAILPGVGSAIGGQLLAAGLLPAATTTAMATAIGSGLANAAIQVAQGKSTEEALKGAVVGGAAGYVGAKVGDYLVGDPGAVKNFVSSTAANIVAGNDPETAAKAALIQTGISTAADTVSQAQATDYLENLPTPDYLNVTTPPTSADVIAAFPETNPNLVNATLSDITTLPAGTVEGIKATLPTTIVGDTPIDYSLAPAAKSVTVDDVVKNIVLENLDTSLQTGTLTADQIDTALNTLTGGYTLGGTTEGIKATLPDTIVSGTEPVDYTLNVLTGGESLKLPTSSNLDIMGGGQGLTANVDGGVLSEEGLTKKGNVILGDPNSFINTTLPLSTDTVLDTNLDLNKDTTDKPLTTQQVKDLINAAITTITIAKVADTLTKTNEPVVDPTITPTITGNPYIPSDISGWARPEYTKTWQAPLDLNSLFTTDNLLGGTQWAGLQGNQFANIPQVSMSDFISSIQNGKV